MRTLLAWFVLSGLLLAGCANAQQTMCELERELFGDGPGVSVFEPTSSANRVVKTEIENAHAFSEGLAAVEIGGRWGFVDTLGLMRIKADYDSVEDFSGGFAAVYKAETEGVLTTEGKYKIQLGEHSLTGTNEGLAFLIDERGLFVVDLRAGQLNEIQAEVDEVRLFTEGLAPVRQGDKWGFLNAKGGLAIPCDYAEVRIFQEGLCAVKSDSSWGYIDKQGAWAIAPRYFMAGDFSEGIGVALLDSAGRKTPMFFDFRGTRIATYNFLVAGRVKCGLSAVAALQKNDKNDIQVLFSYFNPRKEELYGRFRFDLALEMSEGVAAVRCNDRWGYIDTAGYVLDEIKYDTVTTFRNGRGFVKLGSGWDILDANGDSLE